MDSNKQLDPTAELAAATRALRMEIGRRKRWGAKRTAAAIAEEAVSPELIPQPRPKAPAAPEQAPPAPIAPRIPPKAAPPLLKEQLQTSLPSTPKSLPCSDLGDLRKRVSTCSRCSLGASPGRSGAIVGRGAPRPRLLYISDHIGPAEHTRQKPLDELAGTLLGKITTGGMGLKVEETHVTSAVKCALPPGCVPSPSETASCKVWLEEEIRLLAPSAIVTLGAGAAHALFGNDAPGGKLKGRLLHYKGTPAVATFHPRDLVARPDLKASAWADLQLLLPSLKS